MLRIFDLDGTITESRQKISKEMKNYLSNFKESFIVISGASREQMEYQLDGLPCITLAQNGNECYQWCNKLNNKEKMKINRHIQIIMSVVRILHPNDAIEDRGCQISLSFVGHHAPVSIKKIYDSKRIIREAMLRIFPFKSKNLICKVAGTTCYDYIRKNGTKGHNITRWIKENKLKKKDCIYYGDALFKGGNDEDVIGVIKTVAVSGPTQLLKILKKCK